MITITMYYRPMNSECDLVRLDLQTLQNEISFQLVEIDISSDSALEKTFGNSIPVVDIGPYRLRAPFTRQDLLVALRAAQDRQTHYEKVGDLGFKERLERGHTISKADLFSQWFSVHYMFVINLVLFIFAGLPFAAPIFMKLGAVNPARVIYAIYNPLCHQLAFRSWFLFGLQAAYPRALADVPGLISFEQATGIPAENVTDARGFIGNDFLGYKVAFCQRDVAIYGSILLFGLLYVFTKRRIKSIPWYLWFIIGILPIALDGFSQLPSLINITFPIWVPIRESTPFLRTLTGFLFGFTTAWFGFPYIEESMLETRRVLAQKIAVYSQTNKISKSLTS